SSCRRVEAGEARFLRCCKHRLRRYLKGGQIARDHYQHRAAHLKGASHEPARGAANDEWSPVCYGALDPPVGGTFHFENSIMPPLTKACPKIVPSNKGLAFV